MTATDDHANLMAEDAVGQAGLRACQEILREESCRSVRYFAQVDSTNSAACRDLHNPSAVGPLPDRTPQDPTLPLPRLYLADAQTAGRGRLGRQWLADDGTLTFTLLLDVGDAGHATIPRDMLPLVALASGVAVARTIEFLAAPIAARIKWPNDVHVGGGKVAGVLVEAVAHRPDRLVVGIGLNVATRLSDFAANLQSPARALSELGRGPTERYAWLPELIRQLRETYARLANDPASVLEELRARCLLTGGAVRYRLGETEGLADCLGIDDDGSLIIRDPSGLRTLRSGEILQVRGGVVG